MRIDNAFNNLPDNLREDFRLKVRSFEFDPEIKDRLIMLSRSTTFFTDLFEFIHYLQTFYFVEEDIYVLKSEIECLDLENGELNSIVKNLRRKIDEIKEKPFLRDKDLSNYLLTYISAEGKAPTLEEIWKQATLLAEEKIDGFCSRYQKCARTQFCRKDNGEDCFEPRDP
jgi:hypothetical protein